MVSYAWLVKADHAQNRARCSGAFCINTLCVAGWLRLSNAHVGLACPQVIAKNWHASPIHVHMH